MYLQTRGLYYHQAVEFHFHHFLRIHFRGWYREAVSLAAFAVVAVLGFVQLHALMVVRVVKKKFRMALERTKFVLARLVSTSVYLMSSDTR